MADFQAQPTPLAFSSADRRASRVMPDHAWVAMGFLAVATIVLLLLAVCFQLEKMSSKSQTEEEPEASGILSTRFGLGQHIMHIPETEECHVRENEHLDEDIFAVAISSLIRDSVMIINKEGTVLLRLSRLCLSFGLLLSCILIQVFVMSEARRLITSKAVYDIRGHYDAYEVAVYGNDPRHMWTTDTGEPRGNPEHFQRELFEGLPPAEKASVCNIPFTQPAFLGVVLFIWTVTCLGELKISIAHFESLIISTPTVASMHDALTPASADNPDKVNEKVVSGLTVYIKAIIVSSVLIPRVLISGYLLWLGCRWLTATTDFPSLLTNSVALEFILLLKSLLYHLLVPARNKHDLRGTEFQPPSKREMASYWVFLSTCMWGLAALAWVILYIYWFQQVLPDYGWDVARVCDDWLRQFAVAH